MKKREIKQPLGELEAEIMEIVWRLKTVSVRAVLNRLKRRRKVAYTTVMTVMSRLAEKGILKRKLGKINGAYLYTFIQDKESFLAASSKKLINNLISNFGEVAVAQFIDMIESKDFKNAKNWRKKLKRVS